MLHFFHQFLGQKLGFERISLEYGEESCESLQILQILFLGFFVIFMWQKFAATPAKLLFGIRILEEKGLTNPSKAIAFWAFYSTYLYCHYIAKAITDQQ